MVGGLAEGPQALWRLQPGCSFQLSPSLVLYERLEAIAEHKRLQMFLGGVAAGVVGLIAVTLVDLARTSVVRTPNLSLSIIIFAVALAVMYGWKSKLSTPVVLALGAAAGAMALR